MGARVGEKSIESLVLTSIFDEYLAIMADIYNIGGILNHYREH